MTKLHTAANYAEADDNFTQQFLNQNQSQFWLPEEISLTPDLLSWKKRSEAEQTAYIRALAGLTLLDTEQGNVGMIRIANAVDGHQRKALLTFMAAVENSIHARSYSNIFITLADSLTIKQTFKWLEEHPQLQKKASLITKYYEAIDKDDELSIYKALVASVYLESFLFYSGFYYPLYFYGQGELMQCGEIINLIIRDESIHGVYVGLLAQEIYNKQPREKQDELHLWAIDLLNELYAIECEYTADLYDSVELTHDVKNFVKYNANKALANLGFDSFFAHDRVNPIVLNGLNTKTKSHDFFSMKGNGYKKATVEPVCDEDFYFEEAE